MDDISETYLLGKGLEGIIRVSSNVYESILK